MRRLSAVFSPVKCAVARALLRGHYSAEKPLFIGFFLDGGPYVRGPRVRADSGGGAFNVTDAARCRIYRADGGV